MLDNCSPRFMTQELHPLSDYLPCTWLLGRQFIYTVTNDTGIDIHVQPWFGPFKEVTSAQQKPSGRDKAIADSFVNDVNRCIWEWSAGINMRWLKAPWRFLSVITATGHIYIHLWLKSYLLSDRNFHQKNRPTKKRSWPRGSWPRAASFILGLVPPIVLLVLYLGGCGVKHSKVWGGFGEFWCKDEGSPNTTLEISWGVPFCFKHWRKHPQKLGFGLKNRKTWDRSEKHSVWTNEEPQRVSLRSHTKASEQKDNHVTSLSWKGVLSIFFFFKF